MSTQDKDKNRAAGVGGRTQAEEALRETSMRLQTLIDAIPDMVFFKDAEGRHLLINKACERMFGHSQEEVKGKTMEDLLPPDLAEHCQRSDGELMKDGKPVRTEEQATDKDGNKTILDTIKVPLYDDDGNAAGLVGVSRDITERRRMEEDLREARDELEGKVMERTAELDRTNEELRREVFERQAAEEKLAWESGVNAALAGLSLALIQSASIEEISPFVLEYSKFATDSELGVVGHIDPQTGHFVSSTLTRDVREAFGVKGKGFEFKELTGLCGWVFKNRKPLLSNSPGEDPRSSGTHIPIRRFLSVPAMIGDTLVGQVALANSSRDYTGRDQVLLERLAALYALALQRKRDEEALIRSMEEKDILLKEIHHRVKNNLMVISSLLMLQSGKVEDEEVRGFLQESRNRVASMSMIHERLSHSTDLGSVDFAEYVRSLAVVLFRNYQVDASRVRLHVDVPDVLLDIDTVIPCGLIINELVSNALKYAFTENREGELRILLHGSGEDEYELTVKDDGVGFPEGLDFRETGSLGMQIVTSLTDQMDGAVELEREGGTTFRIMFKGTRSPGTASLRGP
jgi:PAS domain S-box-containing protein